MKKISVILKMLLLLVITIISGKLFKPIPHVEILTIAGVLSTISGILFGFVLASISIFSNGDNRKDSAISALKRNNILPAIINKLLSTGFTLILACLFPMIAMFLSPKLEILGRPIDYIFLILGFSFFILSLITFINCWRKLKIIFPSL
ncbi:hypothetical protein Xsto_03910 [Xenorhabdus stockiae]|uniref:Uncharacterized protein n=1 Tax=Xenorhabdus stockiae TaxID=351614 RepID=A0A2D0KAX2_9GAMM|nr:hypothetical protein [Xenorhabdus stockiae]PHM60543.1 hypothetical protein Xsto_03910 [Xenorhabdus stockiae]